MAWISSRWHAAFGGGFIAASGIIAAYSEYMALSHAMPDYHYGFFAGILGVVPGVACIMSRNMARLQLGLLMILASPAPAVALAGLLDLGPGWLVALLVPSVVCLGACGGYLMRLSYRDHTLWQYWSAFTGALHDGSGLKDSADVVAGLGSMDARKRCASAALLLETPSKAGIEALVRGLGSFSRPYPADG